MFHGETRFLKYLGLSLLFFGKFAAAQYHAFNTTAIDPTTFPDYYTVDDSVPAAKASNPNLLNLATDQLQLAQPVQQVLLTVTSFVHHNQAVAQPTEKYNRKNHFGTWRRDTKVSCLDTRGLVLQRASADPVQTHATGDHCAVDQGKWNDPYTDQVFTDPKDVQIDHVVPLKNAYESGAWEWSKEKKCWYANFLADNYHLLAVSGHENMSKGDETPANYMPPSRNFQCDYVKIWLKIKMEWQLDLVQPEVDAINDIIKQNNCSAADLTITADELNQVRTDIANGSSVCQ